MFERSEFEIFRMSAFCNVLKESINVNYPTKFKNRCVKRWGLREGLRGEIKGEALAKIFDFAAGLISG